MRLGRLVEAAPRWAFPVGASWLTLRLLVAMSWLGVRSASHDVGDGSTPFQLGEKLMAWDSGWYRDIATLGYDDVALEGVRFFPGFPLLARALAPLFAGSETAALIVIANVASIGVLIGIYQLVMFEIGDHRAASLSVWAMALFPAGFVMSWAYSEPLMLLCAVWCLWYLRHRRFWPAAGLAFVAGLTRPLGVVLALGAAVEVWRALRDGDRPSVGALASVVAAPLGAAVFVVWASLRFDDWWIPLTIQNDLRGDPSAPPQRLWEGVFELFTEPDGDGLHIVFAASFIVLAVVVARRLPASYTAIAVGTLVVAIGASNLNSLERYGLNAFPLAIGAGLVIWRYQPLRPVFYAVSGGVTVALASLAWWGSYVP